MAAVVCVMETGVRPNGQRNGMDIPFVTCIWTIFFIRLYGVGWKDGPVHALFSFLNDEIRNNPDWPVLFPFLN
jgi:hypothetical protein